jgi:hypothetical protein
MAAVVVVVMCSCPAGAQITGAELGCQLATTQTVSLFVAAKMRCLMSCQHEAFASSEAPTDCVPPYGGATFGCVTSEENIGSGAIQSSCNQDCPECYTNGDCSADSVTKIADAEGHVEALAADLFCDDSASPDGLTLSEHKCRLTAAKFLSQLPAKMLKCYARCRKGEFGGKIPAGDCAPPAADPKTQLCLEKYALKVAFLLDNKCEPTVNPSADKPECGGYSTTDGLGRVAAETAVIEAMAPGLLCSDP